VVSLRIDQSPLPAGLEYFLNTSQWLDASGSDSARTLPKLVAAVRIAIEKPGTPDAVNAGTPASGAPSRASYPAGNKGLLRRMAILTGSLLAVAIGGFAAYRSWLPAHQAIAPPAPIVAVATPATVSAVPPIPERSVAVLPFVDMSEKKDQEYFSDGLSEELIDMLTRVPDLRVPARTSSFYFKGKQTKVSDIGRELSVAHLLEGSVRKSGKTLRITAQLIRVDNGYHEWSETYDRKLDDIFKVQDEIANAVTKALLSSLLADTARPVELGGTSDTRAFDAYLRARGINVVSKETSRAEIAAYDEAIQLDPMFAKAYAGKAVSLASYAGNYEGGGDGSPHNRKRSRACRVGGTACTRSRGGAPRFWGK
jgi:TolB-like protein